MFVGAKFDWLVSSNPLATLTYLVFSFGFEFFMVLTVIVGGVILKYHNVPYLVKLLTIGNYIFISQWVNLNLLPIYLDLLHDIEHATSKSTGYFSVLLPKGQLISKGLFGILNSPKKRTKKFDFNTMIAQFSFVFWEKLKTPKRHFEINWPLGQLKSAWYDVVEKKKNSLELRINDLFNKLPFWTNIPEKILEKACIVNSASPPILHESKEFAKQNLRPKVTKFKIDVSYPIP